MCSPQSGYTLSPWPIYGQSVSWAVVSVDVEGPFCFGHAEPAFLLNLRVEAGVLAAQRRFA